MASSSLFLQLFVALLWLYSTRTAVDAQNITEEPWWISTTAAAKPFIDYCIGPLVPSTHSNPVKLYDSRFSNCALSCSSGAQVYGLTPDDQKWIDYTTVICCTLSSIALFGLCVNLYFDLRNSKKSFSEKPLMFHIPYMITLSTFNLTLLMAIGLVLKEKICCLPNGELSVWNPGKGRSAPCTIFGVLFYSSILLYQFYVLLLSFVLWRQFKNPMNPLWSIKSRYWHALVFSLVIVLNAVGIATDSYDAIEPMGVCLPGPSGRVNLFCFMVAPLLVSTALAMVFLSWSAYFMKRNIDRHKKNVNQRTTNVMADLFRRTLYYAIGVLITLSLLLITGIVFWRKHDTARDGLGAWIQCELTNAFTPDIYGMDVDCHTVRDPATTVSPFWFMSWVISCVCAIIAQIILSFHAKARGRAVLLKQRTLTKLTSPRKQRKSTTTITGTTPTFMVNHKAVHSEQQSSMESVEEEQEENVELTEIGGTAKDANTNDTSNEQYNKVEVPPYR